MMSVPLESLFRRNPIRSGWTDIHPSFGDTFHDLDGKILPRGGRFSDKTNPRLPVILDNRQTMLGDFIPSTSWGSSLANLLTKKSWDALRHPLIEENNHVCVCCGQRSDTLDVHEKWSYSTPTEEEVSSANVPDGSMLFSVQKLDGLMTVCKRCHECFHLGFALVNGHLDRAKERIRQINLWDDATMNRYYSCISTRFKSHNRFLWALDLSIVTHPEGGLTIRSPWTRGEDPRMLVSESEEDGDKLTMILGAGWKKTGDADWSSPTPISVVANF